jgi:hypothetical protein
MISLVIFGDEYKLRSSFVNVKYFILFQSSLFYQHPVLKRLQFLHLHLNLHLYYINMASLIFASLTNTSWFQVQYSCEDMKIPVFRVVTACILI